MRLHDLKPSQGSTHRRKRRGCGESSGLGKTSGRGHKGQKSRSGGGPRSTFEGGQMPLYRRLPKRGFNNKQFKDYYAVVNVATLEALFEDGAQIDESSLRNAGVVKGRYDGLKILGSGTVKKKFNVTADKVSASARVKLEEAGGSVSLPKSDLEEEKSAGKTKETKKKAAKKVAKKAAKKAVKKVEAVAEETEPAAEETEPAAEETEPAAEETEENKDRGASSE